ncbi:EFR1 family ferrodoxin [Intestinibacter sp.]
MQMKKISTLYFSPTNTTKSVVDTIASVYSNNITNYNITLDRNIEINDFKEDELLIIGMPVYGGRIPSIIKDTLKKLKAQNTLCIPVVVYGNRAFEDALLELSDCLEECGFKIVSAAAFIGEHSYGAEIAGGRPNDDDLNIAKEFALKSIEKISKADTIDNLEKISIPGNHPYKESAPSAVYWGPQTLDTCNDCGLCKDVCPMGIIDKENSKLITDVTKCIHCCACVKSCPQNAKVMTSEMYNKFRGFLISNYSQVQKQPELFI